MQFRDVVGDALRLPDVEEAKVRQEFQRSNRALIQRSSREE